MKTIFIILAVILAGSGIGGYIFYQGTVGYDVDVAILNVESGEVLVDQGNGYQKAIDGMSLSLKDSVKTNEGAGVLTFFESIMVELEPNTEVSIKTLKESSVELIQNAGSTWSKFAAISGIDNYAIETPTTVATVRGTSFGVNADEDSLIVGEGNVDVRRNGKTFSLKQLQKLNKGQLSDLNLKEKQKVLSKAKKNLRRMENMREHMIQKKRKVIEKAMVKYDVSESELRGYLKKIDAGEIDMDKMIQKSPVKLPILDRFKKLNEEMIKHRRLVDKLESE